MDQIKTYVKKLREDGHIDERTAQMAEDLNPDSYIEDLRDQVANLWAEVESQLGYFNEFLYLIGFLGHLLGFAILIAFADSTMY